MICLCLATYWSGTLVMLSSDIKVVAYCCVCAFARSNKILKFLIERMYVYVLFTLNSELSQYGTSYELFVIRSWRLIYNWLGW